MPRAALPAPPPAVLASVRPKRKKTGGRQKNSRNKKTLERQILQTIEDEVKEGRPARLMAKEVLDQFMNYFAGLASYYQPGTAAQPNSNADETKFEKYAGLAKGFADSLVGYQSPKYKAVLMALHPEANPDKKAGDDAKIIDLKDANAAMRVYRNIVKAAAG